MNCWRTFVSLTIGAALLLAGCSKASPTVVLDSWWSVDMAKSFCSQATKWDKENASLVQQDGCEQVTSCLDMAPVLSACRTDPEGGVRDFESDMATQFAATPECQSVQLVRFDGPAVSSKVTAEAVNTEHHSLSLDFSPGATKQPWKLLLLAPQGPIHQGVGSAGEIAKQVCIIVRGLGGSVKG